ncbi:MAG: hypothetical protein K2N60_04275 [Oscillospiraceae bacterium]|nr:hypothetical protein [Oscillospiraceae bacterium]
MKNTTPNNVNVQKYEFTVKFEGSNSMGLNSLSKLLNNFAVLTEEASRNNPECKFNIVAVNKGSFELLFEGIAPIVQNLLTLDNVNYALTCLTTIKEWFEIKNHLGFNPPKSVEKTNTGISVTNEGGEVQVFSPSGAHFFENANICNSIININTVCKEEDRCGFKIYDEDINNPILNIKKDDYDKMTAKIPIRNEDNKYISYVKTDLLLETAVCRGNAQWGFYFNKSIKAKIEDEYWLDNFRRSKISLEYGTQMKVNMRIETSRDTNGNPMENTAKYYIEEVLDIVLPSYGKGN